MKTNLLLIAAIFCMATGSFATTHTVTLSGMTFTPSSLTVHPGDIIMWVWADGTHTTTSTTIPAGATAWNNNINSTSTSFSYTPTITGTYQYQCNFHVSMGMVGTFTVVSATGVDPVNNAPVFIMYPNPVSNSLHISLGDPGLPVTITLTSITGSQIMSKTYNGAKETDLGLEGIPAGTYFVNAIQGNNVNRQELTIIH